MLVVETKHAATARLLSRDDGLGRGRCSFSLAALGLQTGLVKSAIVIEERCQHGGYQLGDGLIAAIFRGINGGIVDEGRMQRRRQDDADFDWIALGQSREPDHG